jgi:hypothetical protein
MADLSMRPTDDVGYFNAVPLTGEDAAAIIETLVGTVTLTFVHSIGSSVSILGRDEARAVALAMLDATQRIGTER